MRRHDTAADAGEPRGTNPDGASRLIGIGRTKTYELIASGELRSIKIGRRRVVPLSAIDEFLRGQGAGAA